jgi:transposase-like protein
MSQKGKQRYRCRTCGRSFVEDPTSAAYDKERKEEILRACNERASLLPTRRQSHLWRLAQHPNPLAQKKLKD